MFSVAVLGQDGLFHRRAGKVLMEDLIHYLGDAVKNVPVGDPLVVIGSGSSNGKIITFVAVPLRVHTVQGKRLDRQHIGLNGCSGPGGIDLAAGNIFYIIFVFYIVIFGTGIPGWSVVNYYIFRDNDTAEDDLAAVTGGFYFAFRYFRRIITPQSVIRDNKKFCAG